MTATPDMMFLNDYKDYYNHGEPMMYGPKTPEYFLDKVRYFYGNFSHDSGNLIWAQYNYGSSRRTNTELRDYARGLQSIDKYLRQVGYDDKEVETFRKANISHQPIPVYPKTRNIMISKFLDLNPTPFTVANDQQSQFEKLLIKNRMKLLRQPETTMNVPPGMMPEDTMPEAKSAGDVDFLFEIGGILLPVEIAIKDGLDDVHNVSKMDTILRMNIEDLLDMGGVACDSQVVNGQLKMDYVDYTRVIVRSSIYPDFRDSDVRGYTKQVKMSEIVHQAPEIVNNDHYWNQIKEAYYGKSLHHSAGYSSNSNGYREDYASVSNPLNGYGDFGVTVLKLYWLDIEEQLFVRGQHPRGSRQFERVDNDFNLSKDAMRRGKSLEKYHIQNMYQCHWIVGTDIIYDYGKVDSIVPPGEKGSRRLIWPMQIMAAQEPSLTEKVIPEIDTIQLALLKLRDMIAKMPPGMRMLVYKNRIRESITLGTESYNIKDLIKFYQREGTLIVEEADDYSLPGEDKNSKTPPIEFITSGIGEDLRVLQEIIAVSLDRIREITGINPLIDGTATKSDILKSVVQSMQQSANNALRPWMELFIDYYKNITEALAWKYQIMIATGQINMDYVSGGSLLHTLRDIGPDILRYDLGIKIEIMPTEHYQFLMQSLMEKRDMLPPQSYMAVMNAINAKDLRKAEALLIKFTHEAQAAERAHQERLVRAQAEAQSQSAAAVEQARQQGEMMKLEKEIELAREKSRLQEIKDGQDHHRMLQQILAKAEATSKGNIDVVRENKNEQSNLENQIK